MPPVLPALVLFAGALTLADAPAQTRQPDPLNARAPVPPAVPQTPPPRAASEPAPVDWRTANDRVARVGGWRTYARETLPERAP